jgi:demethylmenaquinone methyltransferase/2-methoxy-6-polyprenyl-1,4-benzoquinol methylase
MNHSTARINYDRMSRIYDLFAGTSERRFNNIGLQMLAAQAGENVLEIGFGTGHSLVALAQAVGVSGKVTGIDISNGMLRETQSLLKRSGLANQIDLRLGDASSLPFKAEGFDAVFTSFTLELFDSSEIPIVLKECLRVLRPEGRLGVVALSRTDRVVVKVYDWAHFRFPDFIDCRPIFVSKVIEEAGFRIKDTEDRFMWGLPVMIVIARKSQ